MKWILSVLILFILLIVGILTIYANLCCSKDNKKDVDQNSREKKIKDAYAELLLQILYDYDGCFYNDPDWIDDPDKNWKEVAMNLKSLLDEAIDGYRDILLSNDKKVIYVDELGIEYNILTEEINK